MLRQKTDELIAALDNGASIDPLDFYKTELGVSASLVEKVRSYSTSKVDLIVYELDNPESNGLIYQEYISNQSLYDNEILWKNKEPNGVQTGAADGDVAEKCAPGCCGGWRPIFVLIALETCAMAPTVYTCAGAAYGLGSMIQDGCFS